MSGRAKGFDPLSNLFDAPNAGAPAPSAASPAPAESASDEVDKVALARALAKAAAAKAAAAKPTPASEADVDKLALAKRLAEEAKARAAAQAAPAPAAAEPAGVDRAELAKALARAAKAKVAAQAPAAPARKSPPVSRAPRTLAERASRRKPVSALEAARAAAAAEEEARKREASRPAPAPAPARSASAAAPARSSGLLGPLGAGVTAEAPRVASDRGLLSSLWKAHALRHIEDGNYAQAGSCLAVVAALGRVPAGVLVAVPAMAGSQSLLVWVDVSTSSILAVIPDGRTYLAGLPGA